LSAVAPVRDLGHEGDHESPGGNVDIAKLNFAAGTWRHGHHLARFSRAERGERDPHHQAQQTSRDLGALSATSHDAGALVSLEPAAIKLWCASPSTAANWVPCCARRPIS
jgi:hypothetical protein